MKDLHLGLTTEKSADKYAIIEHAIDRLSRGGKGIKSAANGAKSLGRPPCVFSDTDWAKAQAIWDAVNRYPWWEDVKAHLPEGMTLRRVWERFKGRGRPRI